MNTVWTGKFWVEELRRKCNEISQEGSNPEMAAKVREAYERVMHLSQIAKRDGLLGLQMAAEELDMKDELQELLSDMINLIIEGTDPKMMQIIAVNKCVALNYPSYQGLISLFYLESMIAIMNGEDKWSISLILKSMMPKGI